MSSPITTHVLDLATGQPARGVDVALAFQAKESRWDDLAAGSTDADGRLRNLLAAGTELAVVIGALQQWGDAHLPVASGPTVERQDRRTGSQVGVAFVDATGRRVDLDDVRFVRTAAYPSAAAAERD